jgi:hypothetical protein
MVKVTSKRMRQDENGQWWYDQPYRLKGYNWPVRCVVRECAICGEEFVQNPYHNKQPTCSRTCGHKYSVKSMGRCHQIGEQSKRWKGGRFLHRGYVFVIDPRVPHVPRQRRKYIQEHRLIMEQQLGRALYPGELVHHKNGVKNDNRPENLELWFKGHPAGARTEERHEPHCPTCSCYKHG